MLKVCFFIFALSLILGVEAISTQRALADEISPLPTLPPVTVTATPLNQLTTSTIIDREFIDVLPRSNGNATELLQIIPGVQFSENFRNSKQGGEIRPPELSISGGRPSDNNYMVDGASINSHIDPDFSNNHNSDNLPGHSQRLFLLDHLIEDVTVLRSNISARYGSFTGGVVEINSINPAAEFMGEVAYRTSRSDWGQFYIDPEKEDDFYNSGNADNQPSFTKQKTSTTLHIPINEKNGLLIDYSRSESSIPINEFEQKKVLRRKNENFFLKYVFTPQVGTEIIFSTTYAPYDETYNLTNTLHSDYTLIGGGYKIAAGLKHNTDSGKLDLSINFQSSQNSRKAPNNWYSWKVTPSKDWGSLASHEGGYGDLEKQEQSIEANLHFALNEHKFGPTKHTFSLGTELSYAQTTYNRSEVYTQYIARLADGSKAIYPVLPCPPEDSLCVDGEQFMYFKNTRSVNEAHADIFNFNIYIEDNVSIKRLTLRPGLRVSYENLQKNLNFAPRFSAAYDIFDNRKTILVGGINRYYGANLLELDLKSKQTGVNNACRGDLTENKKLIDGVEVITSYSCNTSTVDPSHDWTLIPDTSFRTNRVSDLKTPYSDELTLGIQQLFLGGLLELLYIDREYKDQIVTVILDKDANNTIYTEWRNSGRRAHEEVSLSWQRNWPKYLLSFNITWEETKSNSSSYNDSFNEHQLDDEPNELDLPVWYAGKLTDRSQVPINDFNRPYKASFISLVKLPYRLTFTNTTNFRSRYQTVKKITSGDVEMPDGSIVNVTSLDNDYYKKVTKHSSLVFDWKLAWETPKWRNNSVEINFDILNVFNRKIEVGTVDGEYLLGRQYWAGMTYKF